MEEDDPINFFHSLGLQTAYRSTETDDRPPVTNASQRPVADSSSSSLGELGLDDGADARDPWSNSVHMGSDMSFIDAIGLYWLNPATDKGENWIPDSSTTVPEADAHVSTEGTDHSQKNQTKNVESELEELDFLSVLGLTRVEPSGKKWRLWHPEVEDELGWAGEPLLTSDFTHDSVNTDPTVVEDQAHINGKRKDIIDEDSSYRNKHEEILKDCLEDAGIEVLASSQGPNNTTLENGRTRRVIKTPKKYLDHEKEMKISKPSIQHQSSDHDLDDLDDDDPGTPAEENVEGVGRGLVDCESCGAKVQSFQIPKHLISHFHYHRSIGHSSSERLIIDNIEGIVKQSPFQCQPCKFYCNWHKDLVRHVEAHVTPDDDDGREDLQSGTFFCLICVRILNGNDELCQHLHSDDHLELMSVINRSVPAIIQKIGLVDCDLCHQKFRLNVALKRHMKLMHGLSDFELNDHEKYKCNFCDYWSYKEHSVRTHMFLVHPKKNLKYKCNICRKEFKKLEHIKQHRNTGEHKENVFKLKNPAPPSKPCGICNEECLGIEPMKTHMRTQHFRILPQCSLCGEIFYFPQQLKGHVKSKCKSTSGIPRTQGSHKCDSCDFSSDSELKLHRHMKIRHREKSEVAARFKCDQCFRRFFCAEQLENHNLKHHKTEELFKCHHPNCSYITTKKKLFNLHIKRTHRQFPETYPCDQCQKVYESKSSLKTHKETAHQNGRIDNRCCEFPGCDFKYSFESDYKRHVAKHTNEKSIVCNHCDFSCKRKSELTRHFKMKHVDSPPVKCNQCNYQTKNASHLKRHIKLIHKKSDDSEPLVETFNNVAPENIIVVSLDTIEEQIVI